MNFGKWLENRDDFVKYHKTGNISSSAYTDYEKEGGLSWLGPKSKHLILLTTKQYGPHKVEFRQSGEKLRYTKLGDDRFPVYGPDGMALMLSPEEIKVKGLRETDATIVAYVEDAPIGFASNEFGAVGVWVEKAYQKLGIGSDLLIMYMKDNPKFIHGGRRLGQMTPAGENMTTKAYDKLEQEFGKNWFKPNFKEWLNEARNLSPETHEKIIDLLTDRATESKALAQNTTISRYIANILGFSYTDTIRRLMQKYGIKEPIDLPSIMKKKRQDPSFQAAVSTGLRKHWAVPEHRAARSVSAKKSWEDEERKAASAKRMSERNKKLWAEPEYRAAQLARMKKLGEDPEFRELMSSRMKKLWEDPEFRAKTTQNNPFIADFWNHMATFPLEKQIQILTAMYFKNKPPK